MNIAILGAGTAGLACAIALSRRGHRVTVFERHPDHAPVGAGMLIQPSGVDAIHELGIGVAFEAASVPVRRLECLSHRGWRVVDTPYAARVAQGISRPNMTRLLVDASRQRGVDMRMGELVVGVRDQGGSATVLLASGEAHAFDAVVIANGAGSSLPVQCGLSAPSSEYAWGALNGMFQVSTWAEFETLAQRTRGPRKLAGLMPTERSAAGGLVLSFFWSLPVAEYAAWRGAELSAWRSEVLALWPEAAPVIEQIRRHDQLSFATYRHAWPRRLAAGRVCLVGDAAHAMSPQLGLGSTLAVCDALALASCLDDTDVPAGLAAYERLRKSRVKRSQVLSRLLTPCFQADLPAWWRDTAFAICMKLPGARAFMLWSLQG